MRLDRYRIHRGHSPELGREMIQQTGNCIGLSAKAPYGEYDRKWKRGSLGNAEQEEGSRLEEEREAPRK